MYVTNKAHPSLICLLLLYRVDLPFSKMTIIAVGDDWSRVSHTREERDWSKVSPREERDWSKVSPREERDWSKVSQREERDWSNVSPREERDWAYPSPLCPREERDWSKVSPREERDWSKVSPREERDWLMWAYFGLTLAQSVGCSRRNAKIMGSIPRESKS